MPPKTVAEVVGKAVEPAQGVLAQVGGEPGGPAEIVQPFKGIVVVFPNDVAGEEAAQETQQADHDRAHRNAGSAGLEGAGRQAGQAQGGERQQVVQQHAADLGGERLAVSQIVDTHDKLDQAENESSAQAPLGTVAQAHENDGQHGQQGDGTAMGPGQRELHFGQNAGQGDHQGGFHQGTGLGIGSRHEKRSFNDT